MYLNEVTNDIKNLHSAEFRSKVAGWKNFCMYLNYDKGNKNFSYIAPMTKDLYMRAFLQDLILRPSCHNCKAKGCSSLSDITIADFGVFSSLYRKWMTTKALVFYLFIQQRLTLC